MFRNLQGGSKMSRAVTYQPDVRKPDGSVCRLNNGFGSNPVSRKSRQKTFDIKTRGHRSKRYRAQPWLGPVTPSSLRLIEASRIHSQDDLAKAGIILPQRHGRIHAWRPAHRVGINFTIAGENVGDGQKAGAGFPKRGKKARGHNDNLLPPGRVGILVCFGFMTENNLFDLTGPALLDLSRWIEPFLRQSNVFLGTRPFSPLGARPQRPPPFQI